MNWVGPVLLTRYMSARGINLPREAIHGIKLTKQMRKKTGDEDQARVFERKLTFSPFGLTSLRQQDFEGERTGYWNGEKTTPFDPDHRVEFEMPLYWLRRVLPGEMLDPPTSVPKTKASKRKKSPAVLDEALDPPTVKKKKGKASQQDPTPATNVGVAQRTTPKSTQRAGSCPDRSTSKRRLDKAPVVRTPDIIELSDSDDELRLPPPPRLRVKSSVPSVFDFGSPSPAEEDFELNSRPSASGLSEPNTNHESNTPRRISGYGPTGSYDKRPLLATSSSPSSVRSPDVRAARLRHFQNLTRSGDSPTEDPSATPRSSLVPDGAECIDLTDD